MNQHIVLSETLTEPHLRPAQSTGRGTRFFTARSYNLAATLTSGQAFRWSPTPDGAWQGIIGRDHLILRQSENGIQAEVVDPRTLSPLDTATILKSVAKTGRVVVTDESHDTCGVAAGLAAIIADEGFASLKAPIKRVSTMPVPVPCAPTTEDYVTPSAERIVAAVREVVWR